MKKIYTFIIICFYCIQTNAQTPSIYSTLPTGGTVSHLSFNTIDTAYCIIGINLYKSSDKGKNWTLSKGLQFGGAYNFTCLGTYKNKLVAGLNSGGRYYISNDGGISWSDVKFLGINSRVSDIQFIDSLNGFALCSGNSGSVSTVNFLKTTDGGLTWSTPHEFTKRGYDAQLHFVNQNFGLVFYQEYMYRTTNGGGTWDTVIGISDNIRAGFILNEQLAFAGINAGGLLKSTDGLANWNSINQNSGLGFENQILFWNANDGIVSEGYTKDFELKHTTNGGLNWNIIAKDVNFRKFVFIDENNIFLYGANNNIYKSSLTNTSINTSEKAQASISPNPNNGTFQIIVDIEFIGKELTIIDLMGREIYHQSNLELMNTIEINHPGIYIVKIGENKFERIVVK